MFCRNCGQEIEDSALCCPHCGTKVSQLEGMIELQDLSKHEKKSLRKRLPKKRVAGLLAIFLGGLGVHKFYLGDMNGIAYLICAFTGIPLILGIIEGIAILRCSDEEFIRRYAK